MQYITFLQQSAGGTDSPGTPLPLLELAHIPTHHSLFSSLVMLWCEHMGTTFRDLFLAVVKNSIYNMLFL